MRAAKFRSQVDPIRASLTRWKLERTVLRVIGLSPTDTTISLFQNVSHSQALQRKRGGMVFFDLADPSQIVEVVEPLFLNLNAETELIPVMNGDDLRKGLAKAAQG